MQEADKKEFAIAMGEMAVAFREDVDQPLLTVYFKHLISFTMYQVHMAIKDIIRYDARFPKVSRVIAMAGTMKKERPKPMQDVPQLEEVIINDNLASKEAQAEFFKNIDALLKDVGT